MKILNVVAEDFTNYKQPAMFIGMGTCTFKCCVEAGISPEVCQNYLLRHDSMEIEPKTLVGYYLSNSISEAIVIGGLEPFDDFMNLLDLIDEFRLNTDDDIVIYTGYTKEELQNKIYKDNISYLDKLKQYKNIIIKYGRYIPNQTPHYDEVLGVNLASDNQYAERL